MRVLVCGSRHFYNMALMKEILDEIHELHRITHIIEGEARGADTLGRMYGEANEIPVSKYPTSRDLHGRRAGPIRNRQMLREGAPDMVVAFRGPNSRGTQNMIDQAIKAGIPVQIVEIT